MASSAAYNFINAQTQAAENRNSVPVRVVKTTKDKQKAEDRRFIIQVSLLIVAVIALAVYTVYSNMLLTNIKAQITRKSAELTEIQSENVFLDYQIESMMSLKDAQDYAENELGLIKLDSAQIEYVNLESKNMIVTKQDDSLQGMLTSLLSTVADMLGG